MADRPLLTAAIGRYPHTAALLSGDVASPLLRLDCRDVPVISRAFAPMVREARYDISEMAIATFLMAKAHGKPLVLLPVVLASRFQEAALLCRADSDIRGPEDLRGRRVGVRAYSQTTGLWLRGRLQEAHGVAPQDVAWVTYEDAHVAEYRDPAWVTRAAPGEDMLAMLSAGTLDAAIFGNDLPAGTELRSVFPDVAAAGRAFFATHGFVPVNHLLVAKAGLARERPDLVAEVLRLFRASAGDAVPPAGRATLDPALSLAIRYAAEQGLLPRSIGLAEVWEGLPAALA